MSAVPKKKQSKTRGRKRRANLKVRIPQLVACPNCKKKILPHTVCQNCGFYKGKAVIEREPETKVTRA